MLMVGSLDDIMVDVKRNKYARCIHVIKDINESTSVATIGGENFCLSIQAAQGLMFLDFRIDYG